MEEQHAELQGWELLPGVDLPASGEDDGADPLGLFKVDHFVLDSSSCGEKKQEGLGLSESDDEIDPPKKEDFSADDLEKGTILGAPKCSDETKDLSWLDSWGDEMESVKQVEARGELGPISSQKPSDDLLPGDGDVVVGGNEGKARVVWWKLPFEVVKYSLLRVRPVWSISIAAAVVGILMLSRKLHRMRFSGRKIPVAAGLEDKKKALSIPAAAHLNEAFLVLQRVPAIKPSLPTSGVTSWPAIALS